MSIPPSFMFSLLFSKKLFLFYFSKSHKQVDISQVFLNPLSNISSRPTDLFIVRKPIRNVGSSLIGTNCAPSERQTRFCAPRITSAILSTCFYQTALYTCFIDTRMYVYILHRETKCAQIGVIFNISWEVGLSRIEGSCPILGTEQNYMTMSSNTYYWRKDTEALGI